MSVHDSMRSREASPTSTRCPVEYPQSGQSVALGPALRTSLRLEIGDNVGVGRHQHLPYSLTGLAAQSGLNELCTARGSFAAWGLADSPRPGSGRQS